MWSCNSTPPCTFMACWGTLVPMLISETPVMYLLELQVWASLTSVMFRQSDNCISPQLTTFYPTTVGMGFVLRKWHWHNISFPALQFGQHIVSPSVLSSVTLAVKFNPLNPELNPICSLLALLGAHHFLHVSRIRVNLLTFSRLMSYIYGAPILDVSRSHTTTQHSR